MCVSVLTLQYSLSCAGWRGCRPLDGVAGQGGGGGVRWVAGWKGERGKKSGRLGGGSTGPWGRNFWLEFLMTLRVNRSSPGRWARTTVQYSVLIFKTRRRYLSLCISKKAITDSWQETESDQPDFYTFCWTFVYVYAIRSNSKEAWVEIGDAAIVSKQTQSGCIMRNRKQNSKMATINSTRSCSHSTYARKVFAVISVNCLFP